MRAGSRQSSANCHPLPPTGEALQVRTVTRARTGIGWSERFRARGVRDELQPIILWRPRRRESRGSDELARTDDPRWRLNRLALGRLELDGIRVPRSELRDVNRSVDGYHQIVRMPEESALLVHRL